MLEHWYGVTPDNCKLGCCRHRMGRQAGRRHRLWGGPAGAVGCPGGAGIRREHASVPRLYHRLQQQSRDRRTSEPRRLCANAGVLMIEQTGFLTTACLRFAGRPVLLRALVQRSIEFLCVMAGIEGIQLVSVAWHRQHAWRSPGLAAHIVTDTSRQAAGISCTCTHPSVIRERLSPTNPACTIVHAAVRHSSAACGESLTGALHACT